MLNNHSSKGTIYWIPGLAANEVVFKSYIEDFEDYNHKVLNWFVPSNHNQSLSSYTEKFILEIESSNPIFIGLSFGGLIALELGKNFTNSKVILISSMADNRAKPFLFKAIHKLGLSHLVSFIFSKNLDWFLKIYYGKKYLKQKKIYDTYLPFREKKFLYWAFKQNLSWHQSEFINKNIYSIHGDRDEVFPPKNNSYHFLIKNASHLMVITHKKTVKKQIKAIVN